MQLTSRSRAFVNFRGLEALMNVYLTLSRISNVFKICIFCVRTSQRASVEGWVRAMQEGERGNKL